MLKPAFRTLCRILQWQNNRFSCRVYLNYHRNNAEPHVKPLPKAAKHTKSPS
jgi:hypothetical protein